MIFDDEVMEDEISYPDKIIDICARHKKAMDICEQGIGRRLNFLYISTDDLKVLMEAALKSIEC